MFKDINSRIVALIKKEFNAKENGDYLQQGKCPSCGKKSLWTWIEKPGVLQCDHKDSCGWSMTSKELFPELFENINKKYPATPENPNQTADAYLQLIRGINPDSIKGWYEQGKFWYPYGDKGTATLRFFLDREKTIMWERLIETVTITEPDGSRDKRNMHFEGSFKGLWWQPPGFEINEGDEIHWTESIIDAISLNINGLKAVSIMTCGVFPQISIQPHLDKKVTWVLALDNDSAGLEGIEKGAETLRDMKQKVTAMISSESLTKQDWNDCHKAHKLSAFDIKQYRYYGYLALCENASQKAKAIWKKLNENTLKQLELKPTNKPLPRNNYFVFTFRRATYSCKVDAEKYTKNMGDITEMGEDIPEQWQDNDSYVFMLAAQTKQIAQFTIRKLYFCEPENGEEKFYCYEVLTQFSNTKHHINIRGNQLAGSSEFKKVMISNVDGAVFEGSSRDIDCIVKNQAHIQKSVKVIDYIGYCKDLKAYIFDNYAVENGTVFKGNKEGFLMLSKVGVKSILNVKQSLSEQVNFDWLTDFKQTYGVNGLIVLAWWFGCLFVQQIRAKHSSYPFFELIGEVGSGKSDLVDFLYKLIGLESQPINTKTSSTVGIMRAMSKYANFPVMFNEVDTDANDDKKYHFKKFSWDEWLDLYNGHFGSEKGVKTQDNSTWRPEFKAGWLIVQNVPVMTTSEAFLSRLVGIHFDMSHHNLLGKAASIRLKGLDKKPLSGFLLECVRNEKKILSVFDERVTQHIGELRQNKNIRRERIVETHAQIMALTDAMRLILPLSDEDIKQMRIKITHQAEHRQRVVEESIEPEIIRDFWGAYDYIQSIEHIHPEDEGIKGGLLNHHRDPKNFIAIHLEQFISAAEKHRQGIFDKSTLRKYFSSSVNRPFHEHKGMRSELTQVNTNYWIFKREPKR